MAFPLYTYSRFRSFFDQRFIVTIDTSKDVGNDFTLPLRSGFNYDFVVEDWGDGSSSVITAWDDVDKTHTYSTGGVYQITMRGLQEAWYFNNGGSKLKLISIDQFGDPGFTANGLVSGFFGCANLTTISDTTGAWCENIESLFQTFRECFELVNFDVTNWVMPNLNSMHETFYRCKKATSYNFTNWVFSSVNTLYRTFRENDALTSVTGITGSQLNLVNTFFQTFYSCDLLTQIEGIGNWSIASMTTASGMFFGVTLTIENYESLWTGWAAQQPSVQSNVIFDGGNSIIESQAAYDARQSFIDTYNWTITPDAFTGYEAVYDAFTTKPSASVRTQQRLFYDTLKTAGVWAKLDWMVVFAGHTNAANESLINWMSPGVNDASLVNAPGFVAFEGFTGNGTNSYINSNFNLSTDSDHYTQDSCSFGLYNRLDVDGVYWSGVDAGGSITMISIRQSNLLYSRLNDGTWDSVSNTDARGMYIATRPALNSKKVYKNKVSIIDVSTASTGIPTSDAFLLAASSGGGTPSQFAPHQLSLVFFGAGLSPTEIDAITDAFETYMDSNGKGVIP